LRAPRADNRLPQILDAAARLFRAQGFQGASVRDIVRAVGMLLRSLHCGFATRSRMNPYRLRYLRDVRSLSPEPLMDTRMDLKELARRLGATTTFSLLSQEQRDALLGQSPRRRVAAGNLIADAATGLQDHLILLGGELDAQRTWTTKQGEESLYSWRVAIGADGPGFALLTASGSRIRVRAVTDSEYLLVGSEALDDLLHWNDLAGHGALVRQRKVFHSLALEQVEQVFARMSERPVAAGETIVTQGERGDSYYVIVSGEAEVFVKDPLTDETARAAVLRDGDAFGEESLLLEGNRTATVRMTSPGLLLALSKADFDELVKPRMVDFVDPPDAREMLISGRATLLDCRYPMEYEESRIPGARLVPLQQLRREGVFALDPALTYIVCCLSGRRSSAAAFLLRERGVRALSLAGGLRKWPFEIDHTAL
jgi:rhodanese-related sulfurtransferase/AcrR family transcriptional regulator